MTVLAIDAGTTGITVLVIGEDGAVLGKGYREFPQQYPRPGWVEHDPEAWWAGVLAAVPEALGAAGREIGELSAIGITNQRETTVLWDRETLQPVAPAIVWQDRRTAPECDCLRDEGWEDRVRERTGLVIDAYFSGTKLAWLLERVEGVREAAEAGRLAFGTVDSYLVARLTGGSVHATDGTNASRTMMYDIHRLAWDEEILERLRIPGSVLPEVRPSSGEFGVTDANVFLGAAIRIAGIAGDQQAALFGQACFAPGATKNTYGTGSFVLMNTGGEAPVSREGLLTTIAVGHDGHAEYALEGSIFVTGAAIQWLRDGLGLIQEASHIGPLASTVESTDGVYFVPALTGLGAPWWDPYARGTIVGLTRGTTKAHLARAAVEAMAYQTRDVVAAMTREAALPVTHLKADGGASAMDLLLQEQADQLGVPAMRPVVQETTAMGAAYLAGLGTGIWSSREEVAGHWRLDARFEPGSREDADRRYARWLRAVERARGWASAED
ncbi:MAG: glycerol kinase GlpK [Actinobacteria bacterium]|nr:glycerol kinase GlpK [Actinomycetota bacterium]